MREKLKSLIGERVIIFTPYSHPLAGKVKSFENDILELINTYSVDNDSTYIPFDKVIAVTVYN